MAYQYAAEVMRHREHVLFDRNNVRAVAPIPLFLYSRPWVRELPYTSMVLASFSSELYLKGILLMNGIQPKHTHNPKDLFSRLPDSAQTEIAKHNHTTFSIDEILETSVGNFQKIRYMRLTPVGFVSFSTLLVEILHRYVTDNFEDHGQRYAWEDFILPTDKAKD